ncbi:MAG: sensor histidine kinase [Acidimicrobiales bacterium]
MALCVAASLGAGITADRVVDENEAQLLRDRTGEVASLLESLGTSLEAQMASVAAVANVTDGDPEEFRRAVAGVAPDAADQAQGGWAVLRRTEAGFVQEVSVGAPAPVTDLPEEWASGLERAAEGSFTILGFLGDDLTRRFAMVIGRPGVAGDVVVYNETSLIGAATASAADQADNPISGVAVEVYIGDTPDPERLLIGLGEPSGQIERTVVDISGVDVLLLVSATEPLGGTPAARLPWILFIGGLLLGLAIASVVEMSQRRRDDAMATVRDLEQQNRLLDQALAEQRASEAARVTLEAELRQAQRLEAVGHLAGGVAHDFNNVLTAILSYADLAVDAVDDPGAKADLESIRSAARRGAGLTRQLLQFSRREAGEPEVVDVNERVLDVVSMLDRTLGDRAALRCELTADPSTVLADPVELDQVVLNLIVNARDALVGHGTITVATDEVELDADDLPVLGPLVPGRHLRLTVSDDGEGMAPEVLEHAFEPFFTTKGRGQGTGLGLSTVYGIVQRHGGHASARSVPGEGTTVEVLLPAAPRADEERPGLVAANDRSVAS